MKSSLFESQRALSVLAFLCEIRVWGLFWEPGGTSEQKLELNAIPGGTSGSRSSRKAKPFTQCPVVVGRSVSGRRPACTPWTTSGLPLNSNVSRYSEFCNCIRLSAIYRGSAGKRTPRNPASGIPARVINADLDDAPEHREQRARLGSVY